MDKNRQCDCFGESRNGEKRRCVKCAALARVRHVPSDFAEKIKGGLRSVEAAHLYSASLSTITRWRAETGTGKQTFRTAQKIGRKRNLPKKAAQFPPAKNNVSHADMAADFLRKRGPVSRCAENGVFSLTGSHWRCGNVILTDEEIIARAARHGFVRGDGNDRTIRD